MVVKHLILFALLFSFPFLLPQLVYADLGPKPTVDINISLGGRSVPDPSFSAKMLSCQPESGQQLIENDPSIPALQINQFDSSGNCSWRPDFFAWGGNCSRSHCRFTYMPPDKFKLAVYLPSQNRVFITNEISRPDFKSYYQVNLFPDGSAKITRSSGIFSGSYLISFIPAFFITLGLEMITALIFLGVIRLPAKILLLVFLVNLNSLPVVWFILPIFKLPPLITTFFSEIFAVLFEAWAIRRLGRQLISSRQAFVLSLFINLVSFTIGGLILSFLGSFL